MIKDRIMHDNKGELINWNGHVLTVEEGHSFLGGLLALVITLNKKLSEEIMAEFQYFLGGVGVAVLIGWIWRWIRDES